MDFIKRKKTKVAISWIKKNLRSHIEVEFCLEKICGLTPENSVPLADIKHSIKMSKIAIKKLNQLLRS
jgi:hypothetical protein